MAPTLILDTSVLIAGLRSSLGASFALLGIAPSESMDREPMKHFVVELPAELEAEVARHSGPQPGSEAAWVADAVREKLAACAQLEYLEARAARGSRAAYDQILSRVPAALPLAGDECAPRD